MDLVYFVGIAVFFGLMAAMAVGCDRLKSTK